MLGKRHSVKCRHRLALAARGYNNKLIRRIAVNTVDSYKYAIGNTDVTHLGCYRNNVFKASAGESYLSSETFGNIDYLLHTVNVRRKGCYDKTPAVSFSELRFKRLADLPLALGKAGLCRVCGIGKKCEHAFRSELR